MDKPFLPADEQAFYDRTVDGLRRQGWSRTEAEGEAIERVVKLREKRRG